MSEEEKMMEAYEDVASGKYEFKSIDMKFEKKPLKEIIQQSKNIDIEKAGDEVIKWLTDNVEHFIDNKEREFRIDLVVDEKSEEDMTHIKMLQDLYRAIPDDSEYIDAEKAEELMKGNLNDAFEDEDLNALVECRDTLDNVSFKIHDYIQKSENLIGLYDAMIFYYEMIGLNQGQPLLKKLKGSVDVVEFTYESFNVAVTVLGGVMNLEQDVEEECDKNTIKQYIIPEGFSLLLEIAFIDQSRSIGLF
jgi:hypothetical protein